jgi:hypothetical protein
LPWDQLSYWGTTVGASIISSMPFVGARLRFYLLGGHTVNANALLRFYVLHTMIFPLVVIMLIAVHLWRLHKDGGMYEPDEQGKPILPDHIPAEDDLFRGVENEKTLSYRELLFREIIGIEALAVALFVDGLDLEGSTGRNGESAAHSESRQGPLVFHGTAGITPLLSAFRSRDHPACTHRERPLHHPVRPVFR